MNQQPYVLIVEDTRELAMVFEEALIDSDLSVEIAGDGAAAMERLAVEVPDLILLDMHLPKVSGLEVLRYVRSTPHLTNTRVIVMTGNPLLTADVADTADLVLIKPFSLAQLGGLVTRLISGAEAG